MNLMLVIREAASTKVPPKKKNLERFRLNWRQTYSENSGQALFMAFDVPPKTQSTHHRSPSLE